MQLGAGLIDLLYSGTKENMRLLGVLLFVFGGVGGGGGGGLSLESKNIKI